MRIALVNVIKPQEGSGDGITEYTYQLYRRLREGNSVDLVYPLEESKRNNVLGLIYTNSLFRARIGRLAKEDYDIIHITNQELGFAAKILKVLGSRAKVVTSVHDLMRITGKGFHKGLLQTSYNFLVASGIEAAINYSDSIIFTATSVEKDARQRFHLKNFRTTLLGPKDHFSKTPIPKKRSSSTFTVGYIGGLSLHKNVVFVLKTALQAKKLNKNIKFKIYGTGSEKQNLLRYKERNNLDNVSFMGFAPEKELLRIYDSFDAFMYPSVEEGSSLPLLDAQARCLPAVVYKDNNIDQDVTRYCFVARDPRHAAQILADLRAKGYDKKMRDQAREYVTGFSWGSVAKETYQLYKELLKD